MIVLQPCATNNALLRSGGGGGEESGACLPVGRSAAPAKKLLFTLSLLTKSLCKMRCSNVDSSFTKPANSACCSIPGMPQRVNTNAYALNFILV